MRLVSLPKKSDFVTIAYKAMNSNQIRKFLLGSIKLSEGNIPSRILRRNPSKSVNLMEIPIATATFAWKTPLICFMLARLLWENWRWNRVIGAENGSDQHVQLVEIWTAIWHLVVSVISSIQQVVYNLYNFTISAWFSHIDAQFCTSFNMTARIHIGSHASYLWDDPHQRDFRVRVAALRPGTPGDFLKIHILNVELHFEETNPWDYFWQISNTTYLQLLYPKRIIKFYCSTYPIISLQHKREIQNLGVFRVFCLLPLW